ncbi:hypothetical protein ACW2Q0_14605 [Nocardia sp. R16R-3T]
MAIGRTTQSLVAICETGVGRLYYKGVRLSDGASVEIDDPVRTETGFAVTNAGVRYSLSRDALVITQSSTQLASEPMLQYWSNYGPGATEYRRPMRRLCRVGRRDDRSRRSIRAGEPVERVLDGPGMAEVYYLRATPA